jgi:hypothetical protein
MLQMKQNVILEVRALSAHRADLSKSIDDTAVKAQRE